jgi:hypothetical protein
MASDRTTLRTSAAIERRPPVASRVQRSTAESPRSPAQTLQARLGNRATQILVSRSLAQGKESTAAPAQVSVTTAPSVQLSKYTRLPAKVSKPTDPAEREAEETARKVMRMQQPLATKPVTPKSSATKSVQRAEAAPAPARSTVTPSSAPRVSISGGSPLPSPVRGHMEPRFGANLSNVRVHTDASAAQQSARLGANAFTVGEHIFFGKDKFQPQSAGGKELIAHELTHTIQQQAVVQRQIDTTVTQRREPTIQRFSISDGLDWIADKANYLPGFEMLTIILGVNPINMAPVDRSAANILRALLKMIPVTGALIAEALDNYGIFDKVGAWVEGQIKTLGLVGSSLKSALLEFLDSLSWTDVFDLDDVYERGKRIFTDPIDRLIEFGKNLVVDILTFIRDAILLPLAKLAEGTDGYDLLKAVLGKDPITGEKVTPTPEVLIGGFMKLIGKQDIWENAKNANAVPRLWAWFQGAVQGLVAFVSQIPTLFLTTLQSLEIIDLILPPKAWIKFASVFGGFVMQFITWAGETAWTLLEIIFDVVSPGALEYIKKTGAALRSILENPIPFVKNLVKAAKLGFDNFADRFLQHLKAGLIDWLVGALPGIYIPKAFTLGEIAKFVFSALGLTWANIRQKLVKATSETTVKVLETTFDIVVTLVTEGPAAAWDKIKEQLANLKDMVIGGIIDMIVGAVVKKAIPKLIAMFIPGAGFISAILSIYDTVMVFVNKIKQIAAVVKTFIDSIVAIAQGEIAGAAERVERALAGVLSLAINFLAGFAGLGKVADKVMEIINKVREPIDKALDWLVNWIVKAAKALIAKGKAAAGAIFNWWKEKLGFTNKDGESHTLQFIGEGEKAQLGIASNLTPIRTYLDNHPDKGTPVWNTANSVFNDALKVIYTPAKKDEDEKTKRANIKQALAKVSAAFATLSGDPPRPEDYGKSTAPTYGNPPQVEVIVDQPLAGSITGAWPVDKPGYKEIYDAGLTTATDKWVQMHIISEKLGGSGTDFQNLVPAPNSVNTGPFRSFEHAAAKLASGKSGKIKNRVWVEVNVTGARHAATALLGKAGLWLWKGRRPKPTWIKSETPSLTASAGIPKPQLGTGDRKLVLNYTSGTEMTRDFGISSGTAKLVKEGRPYKSQAHFIKSMEDRGATTGQINAVLGRNPVLNGP